MENSELIGKSYLSPNGKVRLTVLGFDKESDKFIIEQSQVIDGVAKYSVRNDEYDLEALEHYLHQWEETTEKIKYKVTIQRMQITFLHLEIEGNCRFDATQIAEKDKANYVYGQKEEDTHYLVEYK